MKSSNNFEHYFPIEKDIKLIPKMVEMPTDFFCRIKKETKQIVFEI